MAVAFRACPSLHRAIHSICGSDQSGRSAKSGVSYWFNWNNFRTTFYAPLDDTLFHADCHQSSTGMVLVVHSSGTVCLSLTQTVTLSADPYSSSQFRNIYIVIVLQQLLVLFSIQYYNVGVDNSGSNLKISSPMTCMSEFKLYVHYKSCLHRILIALVAVCFWLSLSHGLLCLTRIRFFSN